MSHKAINSATYWHVCLESRGRGLKSRSGQFSEFHLCLFMSYFTGSSLFENILYCRNMYQSSYSTLLLLLEDKKTAYFRSSYALGKLGQFQPK